MMPFVLLSWNVGCANAMQVGRQFRNIVNDLPDQWTFLIDSPGALIAIKADNRVLSGFSDGYPTFIIGNVFPREGGSLPRLLSVDQSFDDLCRSLTADCWGAYFAIQIRNGNGFAIYRDPIGMRDGVSWSRSGFRVVASDPFPWLSVSAPPDLTIDWLRLGALLHNSTTLAEAPPLTGIESIPPGVLVIFDGDRRSACRLWEPRLLYKNGHCASEQSLRQTVTHCVSTWLSAYPRTMLEISGGFDSAVVAMTGKGIERGINFFADGLAGDERRYARDVGIQAGIPLDEIYMPVGRLGEADVRNMPVGVCPGLGSTTLFHDRLLASKAVARGTRTLLTGHGGDAVFFQHPTPEIAADPTFPRADFQSYAALAKWTKTSVWAVAKHAFGVPWTPSRRHGSDAVASLPLGMAEELSSEWAGELDGLPLAKRGQIQGIAGDRSAFGTSWRSEALTVIHPLLSQPLVEQGIATDTYILTRGRRDRALAREAFRDLLPSSVADRRGKGSLGHFFGRSIAASTPFLRSFLLDGVLVTNHVLDRGRLEPMLDRDFLMQFDCYGKLLSAIVMEQWARVWTHRLQAIRSGSSMPVGAMGGWSPAN